MNAAPQDATELATLRAAYRVAADALEQARQRYQEARNLRDVGARELACEWSWICWACKRECERLTRRRRRIERSAAQA